VIFLPAFIRRRVEHRPNLVRILDNMGWLTVDKFVRMGVGIVIAIWVARHLGPEMFGALSFALAFVGLVGPLATLGLKQIVVRDLVKVLSRRW
jgi:O-antigen/teichoic acid export membrane protein